MGISENSQNMKSLNESGGELGFQFFARQRFDVCKHASSVTGGFCTPRTDRRTMTGAAWHLYLGFHLPCLAQAKGEDEGAFRPAGRKAQVHAGTSGTSRPTGAARGSVFRVDSLFQTRTVA